jgi:hypothetical protein
MAAHPRLDMSDYFARGKSGLDSRCAHYYPQAPHLFLQQRYRPNTHRFTPTFKAVSAIGGNVLALAPARQANNSLAGALFAVDSLGIMGQSDSICSTHPPQQYLERNHLIDRVSFSMAQFR